VIILYQKFLSFSTHADQAEPVEQVNIAVHLFPLDYIYIISKIFENINAVALG
jgi:hypothetical protein